MKQFKIVIVIGTHDYEAMIQAELKTGDTNGKKLIEAINNNGQYYYYIKELKEVK